MSSPQIFYIDENDCADWDRQLLENCFDDEARRKLLATPPAEWRAQPGWYFSLGPDTEGPFASWEEAYAELQDSLAKAREHKPPTRLQ
jgi:hypothetical protein